MTALAALLACLAAPLLAVGSFVARPVVARCAPGWYLAMGVNVHTGAFSCDLRVPMPEWPLTDAPRGPSLPGRVWCAGEARQDGAVVWCKGYRGRV